MLRFIRKFAILFIVPGKVFEFRVWRCLAFLGSESRRRTGISLAEKAIDSHAQFIALLPRRKNK